MVALHVYKVRWTLVYKPLRTRRHKSRRTLCQGRSARACVHSVGMLCGYMPNSSLVVTILGLFLARLETKSLPPVTRCVFWPENALKCVCGRGSAPDPPGELWLTDLLTYITIGCANFGPDWPLLFKVHEKGQLILRRIVKIVATRCQILTRKCTKIDFGWGSAPDPAGGAYNDTQTP